MASITIRNLDEDVKTKLRVQAAQNNRSMEEEARVILRQALDQATSEPNIADLALQLFGQENGVELKDHPVAFPRELKLE